jgi:hypothetical protein
MKQNIDIETRLYTLNKLNNIKNVKPDRSFICSNDLKELSQTFKIGDFLAAGVNGEVNKACYPLGCEKNQDKNTILTVKRIPILINELDIYKNNQINIDTDKLQNEILTEVAVLELCKKILVKGDICPNLPMNYRFYVCNDCEYNYDSDDKFLRIADIDQIEDKYGNVVELKFLKTQISHLNKYASSYLNKDFFMNTIVYVSSLNDKTKLMSDKQYNYYINEMKNDIKKNWISKTEHYEDHYKQIIYMIVNQMLLYNLEENTDRLMNPLFPNDVRDLSIFKEMFNKALDVKDYLLFNRYTVGTKNIIINTCLYPGFLDTVESHLKNKLNDPSKLVSNEQWKYLNELLERQIKFNWVSKTKHYENYISGLYKQVMYYLINLLIEYNYNTVSDSEKKTQLSRIKDKIDIKFAHSLLNSNKCAILVSEYADKGDLKGWIETGVDSRKEILSMFFQIFSGLYTLQKLYDITHHDLHAGNILVKSINKDKNLYYEIDGIYYEIPNYGNLFIIWDFGYAMIGDKMQAKSKKYYSERLKKRSKYVDDYWNIVNVVYEYYLIPGLKDDIFDFVERIDRYASNNLTLKDLFDDVFSEFIINKNDISDDSFIYRINDSSLTNMNKSESLNNANERTNNDSEMSSDNESTDNDSEMSKKIQDLPIELQFDRLIEYIDNFDDLMKYCETSPVIRNLCKDKVVLLVKVIKKLGIDINKLSINDFIFQYYINNDNTNSKIKNIKNIKKIIQSPLTLDKIKKIYTFYKDVNQKSSINISYKINNLVYLPNLKHLTVHFAQIELPTSYVLPNLKTLKIVSTNIKEIPCYPKLEKLLCFNNEYLETLNKQPLLLQLYCLNTPNLTEIPFFNENTSLIINENYKQKLDSKYDNYNIINITTKDQLTDVIETLKDNSNIYLVNESILNL